MQARPNAPRPVGLHKPTPQPVQPGMVSPGTPKHGLARKDRWGLTGEGERVPPEEARDDLAGEGAGGQPMTTLKTARAAVSSSQNVNSFFSLVISKTFINSPRRAQMTRVPLISLVFL